jgi:aspartyl-tRNA(Asn)/glutamyl-tRNA(Gln) amidotransferase subunit C
MQKEELLITASLARLELNESEIDRLDEAVSGMIEYFSVMDEIDVEGLEPTTHTFVKENRTREDINIDNSGMPDTLLENSPERDERFIVVPNVL